LLRSSAERKSNQIQEIRSIHRNLRLQNIDSGNSPSSFDPIFFHDYSILRCFGEGQVSLGNNVSVNPFSVLYGIGNLTIGNGVRIATHTVIVPANHSFQRLDQPIYRQGVTKTRVPINDDVWIAANVTILDGVTIGEHTVIAAGSVATKSIPDRVVGAGVPRKVVKTL